MKVKKYCAPTMPEVMKKIRNDLGKDAVILNSKEIRTGGFLGFFTKPSLEVVAALDPDPHQPVTQQPKGYTPVAVQIQSPLRGRSSGSATELNEMKELLREVAKHQKNDNHLPPEILTVDNQLAHQGVTQSNREVVIRGLLKKWYQQDSQQAGQDAVCEWSKGILEDMLADQEFGGFRYDKRFLNLIGPTGVGKTTTIAKVAADAVLNKKKKTAMITTDTYRIAAIEQLKTYAEILKVPLEVVYNHDDFENAKEKFRDYDLILVDSAGRNFKNAKYVSDLEQMYQFNQDMENYLVLSLTSKHSDMLGILEKFHSVPIDKLVFTKMDETDTYGDIFNISQQTGLGVAYITTGQNVPDDIKAASKAQVVDMLIGDMANA